jgi:hypothetical protein
MDAPVTSWCVDRALHPAFKEHWCKRAPPGSALLAVAPPQALDRAALALAAGWWGLRSVLTTPVVETLRRAT